MWIETTKVQSAAEKTQVTLYTRVWIETHHRLTLSCTIKVTLYTRVWIETEDVSIQVLNEQFATQHAVGVIAWVEIDAKVENAQKIAALKMKKAGG